MATRLSIVNGPNLNLLGVREPHIYGSTTLEAIETSAGNSRSSSASSSTSSQSNHEGAMVDTIQAARGKAQAMIINPAAYSFTSVALFDVLKTFEGPIFEVHISNIHARDELHRHSKLSAAATAVICGLGPYGYIVAMQAAVRSVAALPAALPAPIVRGLARSWCFRSLRDFQWSSPDPSAKLGRVPRSQLILAQVDEAAGRRSDARSDRSVQLDREPQRAP